MLMLKVGMILPLSESLKAQLDYAEQALRTARESFEATKEYVAKMAINDARELPERVEINSISKDNSSISVVACYDSDAVVRMFGTTPIYARIEEGSE